MDFLSLKCWIFSVNSQCLVLSLSSEKWSGYLWSGKCTCLELRMCGNSNPAVGVENAESHYVISRRVRLLTTITQTEGGFSISLSHLFTSHSLSQRKCLLLNVIRLVQGFCIAVSKCPINGLNSCTLPLCLSGITFKTASTTQFKMECTWFDNRL